MVSLQLQPGQSTELVIDFMTEVDGPGTHREVIWVNSNDPNKAENGVAFQCHCSLGSFCEHPLSVSPGMNRETLKLEPQKLSRGHGPHHAAYSPRILPTCVPCTCSPTPVFISRSELQE